jgi:hypothetical protein
MFEHYGFPYGYSRSAKPIVRRTCFACWTWQKSDGCARVIGPAIRARPGAIMTWHRRMPRSKNETVKTDFDAFLLRLASLNLSTFSHGCPSAFCRREATELHLEMLIGSADDARHPDRFSGEACDDRTSKLQWAVPDH